MTWHFWGLDRGWTETVFSIALLLWPHPWQLETNLPAWPEGVLTWCFVAFASKSSSLILFTRPAMLFNKRCGFHTLNCGLGMSCLVYLPRSYYRASVWLNLSWWVCFYRVGINTKYIQLNRISGTHVWRRYVSTHLLYKKIGLDFLQKTPYVR